MGYVVQARCLACRYKSSKITIGNARHVACICRSCNSVVNPERVQFRFALGPCPRCGASLDLDQQLDLGQTPMDYEGKIPTKFKCPRCNNGDLAFQNLAHFSMRLIEIAPEPDTIVHGQMRYYGKVHVPGMILISAETYVEGLPDDPGDRKMELRTKNVTRDDGSITLITFSFVRYLDETVVTPRWGLRQLIRHAIEVWRRE